MAYDCGIALLLPTHIKEGAYRCPVRMHEDGISFEYTLTREHVPHITLYQGRFASEAVAMSAWKEAKRAQRKQKRQERMATTEGVPLEFIQAGLMDARIDVTTGMQ